MDTLRVLQFILLLAVCISMAHASYYYQPQPQRHVASAQGRVVHVHHYEKGGSYGGGYQHQAPMGHYYQKGHQKGSGGDSLMELIILSSLLGGNGLFGTNTNTANNNNGGLLG